MRHTSLYDGLGFKTLITDGENNPKTAKSESDDFVVGIQHMSHANTAGFGTVCSSASPGCIKGCLDETGHGNMGIIKRVRAARTKVFRLDKPTYFTILRTELDKFVRKADKLGKRLAMRLNGTSDIVWEKIAPWLFTDYPTVQFYDYTKHWKRTMKAYSLPSNYHLTFSRSEINDEHCRRVIRSGKCNVAVVWSHSDFPDTWAGRSTYSADETDLRFLDPPGLVGALYHKGGRPKMIEGVESGFIIPTPSYVGVAT